MRQRLTKNRRSNRGFGQQLLLWISDDYRGTLELFTFPRDFVFSFIGEIITEYEPFSKLK
jgi:hypothetical protein